jgi:hypothetical protein
MSNLTRFVYFYAHGATRGGNVTGTQHDDDDYYTDSSIDEGV